MPTREKLPRQVYTSEFRQPAVELVTREGLSLAEASRRLSLSPKTLTNWARRARGGESPVVAAPRREVTEAEAELSRLRRENAELRMERDILQKSAAYFASEPLGVAASMAKKHPPTGFPSPPRPPSESARRGVPRGA